MDRQEISEMMRKRHQREAIIDCLCWIASVSLIAAALTSNVWLPALISGFN